MQFSPLFAAGLASLAGLSFAAPTWPLADGFPDASANALQTIQQAAHGTLGNSPLPPSLNDDTLTSFKVIAFNEFFEVSFFADLIQNVSTKMPGYETFDLTKIGALKTILAQEELHAITANQILDHYNATVITPCNYQFPVINLHDAYALAATFTDLTIGVLNDIQIRIATTLGSGGAGVISALSQVIGQEGQQDGYFRSDYLGLTPSAQPFLTGASRSFFLTAIEQFIVPGSCDAPLNELKSLLPTFEPMSVLDQTQANAGNITFSVTQTDACQVKSDSQKLVYINGASVPIVSDFEAVQVDDQTFNITAPFQGVQNLYYGLTIAAITNSTGPFTTASDVANATVFGPALIEFF